MLEHEYHKRRKKPGHLSPAPEPLPSFDYSIRAATAEDLAEVLALYRHYVRNSVVTFDEKPPTLRAFRSKFEHTEKLGYPFLVAVSRGGELLGYARVQPFRQIGIPPHRRIHHLPRPGLDRSRPGACAAHRTHRAMQSGRIERNDCRHRRFGR